MGFWKIKRLPPKACNFCKKWGPYCQTQYSLCQNRRWLYGPQHSGSAPKDKSRIIRREWKTGYNNRVGHWLVWPIEHPFWKRKRFLPNRLRQKRKPK